MSDLVNPGNEVNPADDNDDEVEVEEPEAIPVATAPAQDRQTVRKEQRRQLLRDPSFIIGFTIVMLWIVCAVFPGLLTTRSPDVGVTLADGTFLARSSPGADAWFGTDGIGRDVFSRVIYGARSVLTTAPVAAALAVAAGAFLGLLMGYF